jgi:uncharacterized membrane protein YidH (DUF202 family)
MDQGMKTFHVQLVEDGLAFSLAVYPGTEPNALERAIAARATLESPFFLTTTTDPNGVVLPLSSALPDGSKLMLHLSEAPQSPTVKVLKEAASKLGTQPTPAKSAFNQATVDAAFAQDTKATPLLGEAASSSSAPGEPKTNGEAATQGGGALVSAEMDDNADPSESGAPSRVQSKRRMSSFLPTPFSPRRDALNAKAGTESLAAQQLENTKHMVDHMERFQRLSTDLANERTFLAWSRTALAAIRTVFAFYGMEAAGMFGTSGLIFCQIVMTISVLVGLMTGRWRYTRMKAVIDMKHPPRHFGRMSVGWFFVSALLVSMVTFVSICSRQWAK